MISLGAAKIPGNIVFTVWQRKLRLFSKEVFHGRAEHSRERYRLSNQWLLPLFQSVHLQHWPTEARRQLDISVDSIFGHALLEFFLQS